MLKKAPDKRVKCHPRYIKELIQRKAKWWKCWKITDSEHDRSNFMTAARQCSTPIKNMM
jgi:hypothetical protein